MALLQKGVEMAVGRMPKLINPTVHAVIDYAVAGSFFLMAALYWRRNKKAAISALVCGGATAANSLLTDYPGGAYRVMSYKSHGRIDAGLAGVTGTMPRLMGFSDDPEARFFGVQALAETTVTALTDFEYYEHPSGSRLRHSEDAGAA
jgi:hypothetical protein